MMKKLTTAIAAATLAMVAMAIPAKRAPFTVTNSDGTQLTIVLCGDEHYHFYTTTDGIPVVQEENDDYRLAPELTGELLKTWQQKRQQRCRRRMQKAQNTKVRREFGHPSSYTGDKKGIVILVNFPDLSMKSEHTQQTFDKMFNQEGYNEDGHTGSVHDYFYDQSYGQFNLTFDIVGPVTVSHNYAYYGKNNQDGEDSYPATLTIEACRLANNLYDIDWNNYDWDGDKNVDQVYIIYAGYGEHAGAPANTIWPHEFDLTSAQYYSRDGEGPIKLDGCTIDTYAMSCELSGTRGNTLNGIGTACHEFSHCLGFPDFYDTSYAGGFGMNAYSLMDAGAYNGKDTNGECPSGLSAYERWFAGWLELKELSRPQTVTDMPCLGDTAVAYIIYNDGNPNEYFTLENRQNDRWFKYTSTYTDVHGLLVCHIDYNEEAWWNNEPNIEADHQRMSIIPAGKTYGVKRTSQGETYYDVSHAVYRSHLFPGSKNVTQLSNTSHKSCGGKLFNVNTDGTNYMQKPITEISETDGKISFKFMGGNETAIQAVSAEAAHTKAARYYRLDGTRTAAPTLPGIYIMHKGGEAKKIIIR